MQTSRTVLPLSLLLLLTSCETPGASHVSDASLPVPAIGATERDARAIDAPHDVAAERPTEPFPNGREQFELVLSTLRARYYDAAITEDELYRAATRGMLELADPHMGKWNTLMTPGEVAALQADLQGQIVGIGVAIEFDAASGHAAVLEVVPGSPAERAGLAPGDRIVADVTQGADVAPTAFTSLQDVVSRLRGEPGTTVTLRVLRRTELETLTLERARIEYETVRSVALEGDVGYLRVESFVEGTRDRAQAQLRALKDHGARRIVIDMRGNPGGSFEEAIDFLGLFVPRGTEVVMTRMRDEGENRRVTDGDPVVADLPLAVLVDHETSSGAEMVAASLRSTREALLVGEKTLGKWSVQSLDELPNGYGMKFTVTLMYLPSGETFEGEGVEPDIGVSIAEGTLDRLVCGTCELVPVQMIEGDGQLRTAVRVLRAE